VAIASTSRESRQGTDAGEDHSTVSMRHDAAHQGFLVQFSVWRTKKPSLCAAAIKPTRPARIYVDVGQAVPRADTDVLNTRFNHRSGINEIANNFCCFTRAPKGTDVQDNVAPFQDCRKKATDIFRWLATAPRKRGVQFSLISPLCIPFRFALSQKVYPSGHSWPLVLHLLAIIVSAERIAMNTADQKSCFRIGSATTTA
jgi:hypothetical protein